MKLNNKKVNWGSVVVDISVMIMAVGVSIWRDNPLYLWLLALLVGTGSYDFSRGDEE